MPDALSDLIAHNAYKFALGTAEAASIFRIVSDFIGCCWLEHSACMDIRKLERAA